MLTVQGQSTAGLTNQVATTSYSKRVLMQVGRENPSELKAAKLARSMARGVEDRDLKPNTKERQQIEAVIVAPPNRYANLGAYCAS